MAKTIVEKNELTFELYLAEEKDGI